MKYNLLSSVAGIAIIAATNPALAGNDFSGVAQFTAGMGTTETSFLSSLGLLDDPLLFDGDVKGIWPLSQEIHLQIDLTAEHTDNLVKGGDRESATLFGATAHLLHPFENRARFGLAGSIWESDLVYFAGKPGSSSSATYGLAAVEGQFFGSDWTLTGQAGVFNQFQCSESCPGSISDGTYGRAKIRYFLHDNTSLSVEMLQMWGALDDEAFEGKSVTNDYSKWALEAEHRFGTSPWSGTFAVSHEQYSVDLFETSMDTNTVSVGLKFYLDQPTLRAHDRSGAEMDTPNFGNAIKSSSAVALFQPPPTPSDN